jgi:recombination protein RecA
MDFKKVTESLMAKYKDRSYTPKVVERSPKDCYSFGSIFINYQLSGNPFWALPPGKAIELYGPEGTFKTTLLLHLYADCQAKGRIPYHIDGERAFYPQLAQEIGIDLDRIAVLDNESCEDAFEMILDIVSDCKKSKVGGIIGVDSVDSLLPNVVLDKGIGDSEMAAQAILMGRGMKKLTLALKGSEVTVVFINQIRSKIGVTYGSTTTRRGGAALKYYAWINIEVRTVTTGAKEVKDITGNVAKTGVKLMLKATKNKQYPPFRTASYYMQYGKKIDPNVDLLETCIAAGFFSVAKRNSNAITVESVNNLGERYGDPDFFVKNIGVSKTGSTNVSKKNICEGIGNTKKIRDWLNGLVVEYLSGEEINISGENEHEPDGDLIM